MNIVRLLLVASCLALAGPVWAQDGEPVPGDIGTKECRDAQLLVQSIILSAEPRNHGAVMSTVANLLAPMVDEGGITDACRQSIHVQFAQKVPIEEQEASGLDRICGDGEIDPGEECDEGGDNSDEPDACRPDCTEARCGDGVVDTGEQCDAGEGGDEGCTPECTIACPTDPSSCDDGNECTDDFCEPFTGCSSTPAPPGTSCSVGFGICDGEGNCLPDPYAFCPCAAGFAGVPFNRPFGFTSCVDTPPLGTVLQATSDPADFLDSVICVTTVDRGCFSSDVDVPHCTFVSECDDAPSCEAEHLANARTGLTVEQVAACRLLILDRAASLGIGCAGDG
jgi:hypothetical protein